MNKENDSAVHVEEMKFLSPKDPLPILKKIDTSFDTYDSQNGRNTTDAVSKEGTDLVEQTITPRNEWIKIRIWRDKIIHINRSLIPLRISLFFWFASGSLYSPLFSLMLINRGLELSDFSSIFSIIFLLQFLASYTCGIVVDKLGNAKPVLLFLMLSTVSVVIGLLLSPSVKKDACVKLDINETCFDVSNYTLDLEYCKHICFRNETDNVTVEVENINRNGSYVSAEDSDVFSKSGEHNNAFYENGTTVSCNEICSCLDPSVHSCRNEYKAGFKILYSALILSFFPLWSTAYRFLDFAALNAAKKYHSDFGRERFYGSFGITVVTLLCNFVLSIDKSRTKSYYDNVYWFSVVLNILSMISAYHIRNVRLPPGIKLSKKTLKMLTDIEIMFVFLVAFAAGVGFTFNKFFQLLYLDSLEASKTVIGLHIVTGSFYGLPMYFASKSWMKKFGKEKILIIGLLSYVINATSYSFLYYPWTSLIIEITNAFSFHLFWIAIVVLAQEVAPEGLAATVNAVVGAVHFGIGRSFSVSVGGYLYSKFGARATFRILAVFCLITAVLYSIFLYLRQFLAKKTSKEQSKEEIESMKGNEA